MQDFEKLMLVIYEETITKDKLFVGFDVLMKSLGLDKPSFLRVRAVLDRKGFLDTGVVQMDRLNNSGINYVESQLL